MEYTPMRQTTRARAVIAVLLVAAAAAAARAIEQTPMPAFSVARADGTTIGSSDFAPAMQYVFMYVTPNCRPCDRLVDMLKDTEMPQLPGRVVIVVGGSAASGEAYIRAHVPAEAGQVAWFADPAGEAFKALRLTGAPVLI